MSFSGDVAKFRKDAVEKIDQQVRSITLRLFRDVILATPVGRPELWERNRVAANYNQEVSAFNSALRADASNLDKRGHLKRGRKLNDSMDIQKPKGYVGGRLRGNWNASVSAPDTATTKVVDPSGIPTIARAAKNIGGAGSVTYLANGLPYAVPIEYGHSKYQAPAGMVRVNVARYAELKVIKI